MRWSLNETVIESSGVRCELCCDDCQGDRTEYKKRVKSSKNMTLRHLLHVDSLGCLSNHGFNACTSDAEERIDQPRFHWAQLQHSEERIARCAMTGY